ncbi:MAG TPA: carbohydrate esterase family protein [Janthinobacterium sp.]|nr:carbohydrate esterase family protein [Janthinobacterium sp.]
MSNTALSILIYHRVLARPDPLCPAEPDGAAFERQLRLLKRFFTVLPLGLAVRLLRQGALPPRACCITFDDGYADNAEVALPLLLRHGLSACFFIATGYLNGGQMWNDSVIERVRHAAGEELDLSEYGLGRLPIGKLEHKRLAIATILGQLKYLPFETRQGLARQLRGTGDSHYPANIMMRHDQVRELHRAGMEIGAHTQRHPILAGLSDLAARADILDGRRTLEQLIQAPVDLFAYPNGRAGQDYGPRHVDIVKDLGFDAAVATDWGVARQGGDLFQLPRFTPWDRGRLRFLLRMGQNMLRRAP